MIDAGVKAGMTRAFFVGCFVFLSLTAHAQQWPSFRGDNASGVAAAGRPPSDWDVKTSRNIRWKVDVPGLAHSSPIVWRDRVYLTTTLPLEIYVVRAGRTFELIARNSMGQLCMATPAIAGDLLFVRTRSALYAIGERTGSAVH